MKIFTDEHKPLPICGAWLGNTTSLAKSQKEWFVSNFISQRNIHPSKVGPHFAAKQKDIRALRVEDNHTYLCGCSLIPLKRLWLKCWLPCPDGGFLLHLLFSLVTLPGTLETVGEEVGTGSGWEGWAWLWAVLLGCSDINSGRTTARKKRHFPLLKICIALFSDYWEHIMSVV